MSKKTVLIAVPLVLIGALLAVIAAQPSTFRVERSITIAAPAEIPFSYANDFTKWAAFSPWENRDPEMKKEYSSPPSGKGATYSWSGNDEVGTGSMTILESVPNERIEMELKFITPFESVAKDGFTFAQSGEGTRVTWHMHGDNDFMGKAFSLFMDMDKLIGGDFEQGLATLKTVSEAEAKQQAEAKAAAEKAEAERQAAAALAAETEPTDPGAETIPPPAEAAVTP